MKLIIRYGGLIPTYYGETCFTCHHTEAKKFDTIEECRAVSGNGQIVNAETLEFIAWVHY